MNKKNINELIDDLKQKLNGYTMLYYFHLSNLCIKADPIALLSATIEIDGEEYNLEDVAYADLPDEYTFSITPKNPSFLFPISKAIKIEHPEFKMEEKIEQDEITQEEKTVIYYTMPIVNEDRRDVCTDYIKTRYEATQTKMEAAFSITTAKVTAKMVGASAESVETAKNKMQEIYDWYIKMAKRFREDKEKEVEEGYQKYLKSATQQAQQAEEKEAAKGRDTLFSMRINEEE
ncbi:MAG: ribosome recycling factor [Parabacteroides sp.]|nr:ribosome recycling factor [Parabacteroides sp.]